MTTPLTPQRAFLARLKQERPATLAHTLSRGVWPSREQLQQEACALHPLPLAEVPTKHSDNLYNWGTDRLWLAADGTGVLCAQCCFGAVPGDGIDTHIHLLLPGDIHATFHVGMDYTQPSLTVEISGPSPAPLAAVRDQVCAMLERHARR